MSDDDALSSTLGSIYQSVLDPSAIPQMLERLRTLLGCASAAIWNSDTASNPDSFRERGYDARAVVLYNQYYHSLDPGLHDVVVAPLGQWTPVRAMRLWDHSRRLSTSAQEFIHDFCIPYDIRWLGGGKISHSGDSFQYLGFRRGIGQPDFDAQDRQRFCQVMPHLQRAAQIERLLADWRSRAESAEAALQAMAVGVMLVDDQRRLRYANPVAERLLEKGAPLACRHGLLQARLPREQERLQSCLDDAGRGVGAAMSFAAATALQALQLMAIPAPDRIGVINIGGPRSVIVLVGAPEATTHHAEQLRRLFSLTPAEARLTQALARGETLEEISQRTATAVSTLRTQLANSLGKTGAHSQAQLVTLARTLPGLLSGTPPRTSSG